MKRSLSLMESIKIFWIWMRLRKNTLTTSCGKCNAITVRRVEHSEENKENGNNVYNATYQCQKCGAVGVNKEVWADYVSLEERRDSNNDI